MNWSSRNHSLMKKDSLWKVRSGLNRIPIWSRSRNSLGWKKKS